ncbi:MAG: peptidylprolyl isomerase [bacterium]|nr:peptidylprolyl isomerase [bacterium]
MATDKRERQRAHRQVARQRANVTAVRGRIRSRGVRIALITALIVVAVVIFWLMVRGGDEESSEVVPEDVVFPELPPPPAPGGERTFDSVPDQFLDPDLRYSAAFDTSLGVIRVRLDQGLSPEAVNAFAVLADEGYYDGSAIFYTDPTGGYIQGGSPHTNTADDPGPGFTVAPGESVEYKAGQLLWSAEGVSTGQFLFLADDGFQPPQSISGLTVLGQIEDNSLGLIRTVLNSHVDDPDTAFGGRPSEAVIIKSIDIETTDPTPEGSIDLSGCPPADGSGPQVLDFDGPQPMCLDAAKQYTAVFDTTAGEMRIALDVVNTPITANNFAVLARYHYYDDTLLFRTDPGIGIIQGGAPHTNSPSDRGPGYTIPDEGSGFTYEPGQIVMARTAAPNSASAQFFFAVNEQTARLNNQGTYVVFGQMDDASLSVAEAILASHVDQPGNPLGGGPDPQVIVNSVTIEETG